jgi:MFS family permease
VYSLLFPIIYELVPPEAYATYVGIGSGTFGLGLLLGPIFGGVINDGHAWRWIFFLKYVRDQILELS